jgi:formate dehydrogenase iron-sulfur subunit
MTPEAATAIKTRSTLVDITNCIGCRACQVACKQWNDRPGEETTLEPDLGFQNPVVLSAKTLTLIKYDEIPDEQAPGGLRLVSAMWRCLHCLEPACVSSCPTTALERKPDGPVVYSEDQCIGCRYCMWACPWGVPSADWDTRSPKIHKCTHCADRCDQHAPAARNDQPLTYEEGQSFLNSVQVPACVKACPADALVYGDRDEMLAEARRRMAARPGRYVDHIYGEKEAGGTSVLYLSAVPFEKLGFPDVGEKSYPGFSKTALHAVPPAVMAVGAMLGMVYAFLSRRTASVTKQNAASGYAGNHHPVFEPLRQPIWTPFNIAMLALMAFGAISFVSRFVLGLGNSTQLSDTYAWGLWIVFDLVWIAIAAGAFATAGLIYVFQRKDLYSMGRSAVLMGLLSYSFVMVTLLADLGQPLHAYQLAIQAPPQSAMFEVSWCVGLYVSVLLIEFLPVPLEYWGWTRAMAIWKRWQGAYVAFAVTLFVYVLSRHVTYAAAALAIFSALAWAFRPKGDKVEPIMLAIAAVTLSTMHQSSLGSLFLLMHGTLAPQWWSPVLPVSFFLSAIAAGTGLVIVIEMWIARAWKRTLRMDQLAAVGQITFWSLLVYFAFRLGDMAVRGQFAGAFSGLTGALFTAELVLGGLVPLALLARKANRLQPSLLFAGALLTTLGVIFNRVNVVLFAMNLKGSMPQVSPETYSPTLIEWGLSIGLFAAAIFLFGLAARLLPVLPQERNAQRAAL